MGTGWERDIWTGTLRCVWGGGLEIPQRAPARGFNPPRHLLPKSLTRTGGAGFFHCRWSHFTSKSRVQQFHPLVSLSLPQPPSSPHVVVAILIKGLHVLRVARSACHPAAHEQKAGACQVCFPRGAGL